MANQQAVHQQLLDHFQNQAGLVRALGVTAATVSEWFSSDRPIPPLRALQIEGLTGGKIRAEVINPKCKVLRLSKRVA